MLWTGKNDRRICKDVFGSKLSDKALVANLGGAIIMKMSYWIKLLHL